MSIMKYEININNAKATLFKMIKDLQSENNRLKEKVNDLESFILNLKIEFDKKKPVQVEIDGDIYVIKDIVEQDEEVSK